jgi:hypothetical protein
VSGDVRLSRHLNYIIIVFYIDGCHQIAVVINLLFLLFKIFFLRASIIGLEAKTIIIDGSAHHVFREHNKVLSENNGQNIM